MRANSRANVRVFVIWEPVLVTDWWRPSQALTSLVPDPRAVHFYDLRRQLSGMYGGRSKLDTLAGIRKVGFRMKNVVWDAALVYPPGAKWGSPAQLLVAPVVEYRDDLADAMAQLGQ
ncbi:MAG: hypothetical protein LAQ69_12110 [Acidobacteriia bacterium]|nr:hypothetical protein [Terriglobia bacterium]